ncbi:hypothetical protein BLA24_07905 [Streptomyces cinnamoneus]|uniref:Uncharacterized protein n=2 Tax=Streptomyces cinnamoneus TaxID=53446 RepID=A0A2G1XM86_STRCJ|nr:hypothetical protein [Streptomyces cinnamoneus]PHQ52365.1 hypothetical protein BLA24_07905 [Streptomyces cinnamoneus]PPT11568.1 hypothetical protein CYQ11_00340 [Streptomyces cinnamoneus]
MLILNSKTRHRGLFPVTASMTTALPLAAILPAMTMTFSDQLGTSATIALILAGLALIACTAGLTARAAARNSSEQARRDQAVLDALEPLAGLRR